MNRQVTWGLVMVVGVLAVQDRKKSAVLKELQGQRRWVVQAKGAWEAWREDEEVSDGEMDEVRVRLEQVREALGMEWRDEGER
jgi:hypothetical protein